MSFSHFAEILKMNPLLNEMFLITFISSKENDSIPLLTNLPRGYADLKTFRIYN